MAATVLASQSWTATFDNAAGGTPVSNSFTVPSGSNLILYCGVSWDDAGSAAIGAMSFNSVAFTSLGTRLDMAQLSGQVGWLVNPDQGTYTLTVDPTQGADNRTATIHAVVVQDVDTADPHHAQQTATGDDFSGDMNSAISVTGTDSDGLVFCFHLGTGGSAITTVAPVSSSYTEITDQAHASTNRRATTGYAAGTGGTVTMTALWSTPSSLSPWGVIGFNINSAAVASVTYAVTELTISSTVG